METISRHELVPFTALMNMIKFNYLEKKEVFQTLLGILEDYDPTDEENKKKTTRYIELLLSDQSDLAEYLLSFLPNGMSVDHIGVTEVKDENKLNLKKKKTTKLKLSRPSSSSTTVKPEQTIPHSAAPQQELTTTVQKPTATNTANKIPILPAKMKNSPKLISSTQHTYVVSDIPITQNSIQHKATEPNTTKNTVQSLGLNNNSKSEFNLSTDNLYQVWGNSSDCSLNIQNNNVCSKDNIQSSSVQILSSNFPLVYVNNGNQTPVCPVVPSVKLQKVPGDREIPINSMYLPRQQCDWLPVTTETVTEPTVVPLQFSTNSNFTENTSAALPREITTIINEDENIQNLCNTADDLVFDLQGYSSIPENVQYIQHEPLLPNVRFPMHSTPKTNYTPNTGILKKSIGPDLLSMIQQPIIEQQYPQALRDVGNSNLYPNTRNLSSFPYTHEFVLPNGKTQNLYINRTPIQMEQALPSTQNNIVIKHINKNQPSSVQLRNNITALNGTGLPVQNITNLPSQVCSQTTIYNPNNVQLVPTQPQIIRKYPPYTSIQTSTQSQPSHIRNYMPYMSIQSHGIVTTQSQLPHNYTPSQNRIMGNLIDTPHDMLTPIQYNQELNILDPILSDLDNTGSLHRNKPKKLTMTANSGVRKKLRLTPNNSNVPI